MKRGFTLIELMVSVAIIALLSAIVIAGINNARERSRDARRMSNLDQIGKALALYYTSTNAYPVYTGNITGSDALSATLQNANTITAMPKDPVASQFYTYTSAGTTYTLGFCLETNTINGYAQGCGNEITQ